METDFKTPVRQKLTTIEAEREFMAIAEEEFKAAGVADAPARAKLVCERYRYRARRKWKETANIRQVAADIIRFKTGVVS